VSDKQDSLTQTAIKLAGSVLERADRLAEKMKQPGMQYTRSDVLRMSIHRGLAEMEAEVKKR
jgi:predicted DNA-binding protein